MAKKRNKSLEEIFKGTGVNISSTQPASVAQQNQNIQKQGSWNNTGSKQSGGTRIVGTGGGVMPHTDTGAQRAATLSGSPYSKTGALVDAFSRGVGKSKTNNAATAFKPAPVMSKPKQTKQDRLAAVSAELDEMKNQRTQLVKDSVGKKAQTQKITELNSKIQKAKDEQKKLEKDVYGYTGNFFKDAGKRTARFLSGTAQSVVGQAAETVGQIGRFGADADDPRMYATTGAMINEARNPGALQRQHEAVQGRVQDAFNTSDAFAEESAKNIESAKGGLGAVGKLAVDVGSEGLKLAGDMALNTIAPGSGLAAMGVRAFGSGAQEARQAGATGDQQFLYGAATAGIEMLTEKMFSAALPFKQAYGGAARVGGKTLDDAMDAVIGKVVKSPAVRALAHNFIGEGIEEQASDLLNPVAKLTYDKDAVHDTYLTAEGRQQLAEDLLRDGLVGAILGGLGATGNVVSNVAVGNRLMKNGGSGAANVLASAASFPEQSEAHKTATELIERHDQGGKITPYELGDLVHQMQEAAAHGVYPDETGGTYEVLRDAKGNWRVVHQINETAQALNEKGVDTKDAIKYAAVLDSLAQSDDMSVSQVKRKLDVFSPAVREQVEQMTGRALPEATSKADTARAIKAAFTEYRAEVEEEERLAEAERQAAAEAEEQAAIAEESDAEAAQFMEQAVAEQEQALVQEQAQQAQQQQAEEPSLVQPLETLEEFLARKDEDARRRYGEGLSEEERKELTKAWEQSTKNDGIRLDDGTTIGFAEFAEVMRPYLSKEEGYTVSDSKLMAAFNKFRAASAEQPISRATWEKNIAATRGDTSAQPESVTAEETAEEEPGASVLSVEEETAPVEETPAEEPAATVLSVAEESAPVEESAPAAEEKPVEKKPTQQAKTSQKKQTVIPTKAEAEAAKTATQSKVSGEELLAELDAEISKNQQEKTGTSKTTQKAKATSNESGDSAESIQNAIKVLRDSGAKTQHDVFGQGLRNMPTQQAYWLLQDNGLISVKPDGSFTIKNTTKNGGVKHSLATQSKNPNIKTNENVTLEQRLAAEFLMEYLKDKGIKGIVFDGKNLEGEDGHIDKSSGIIYLNEDYLDTAMAVAQTVGHEIFHAGVEGDANLVNAMLESAKQLVADGKLTGRNGRKAARWLNDIDAEVAERAERYRAFLEKAGADAATIAEETSPEAMREEIACDLMGMVLNNQSALDTIAQTEPTLLDRIIEALDRLLGGRYSRMANYATGGEDTSFAQYGKDYANTVKELDKIAQRLSTALDNYRDNRPQTSGEKHSVRSIFKAVGFDTEMDGDRVIVKDQDGKTVTHVTKSMVKKSGLGTLINLASKEGKTSWYAKTISKRDAEKQSQAVADLLNMVITAQDGEMVWRFAGSAIFSAIKTNSDGQYNTTIDFSTVCRKTRNMVTAMSEVMKRQKRGLTKDEVVELQGKILAQGGEVNCPVCYVFSRWAGIGGILENMYNFQNKYGHEYDPTVREDGTLDWSKLDARIAELTAATKSKPALRALLLSDKAETTYQDLARELEENQSLIKQWRSDKKQYNTKALKAANAEQIAELNKNIDDKTKRNAKIKDEMKEIEKLGSPELAWLKKVRRDENYWKAVKDSKGNLVGGGYVEESDVLFDLDAGDKFAERYPLAWKYRTGRGPSAGKAIQPYADMRMGDLILGPGNNSANGNTTFETVGEELTPEQEKAFRAARKRTMAQNLIGGQRFQSTSDFRYDYGLDYLQTFLEAQALGSTMQSYTKVLEFVTLAASVGGDVNISVMPLGKGYNSETGQLEFSDVTGVNIDDAIRLSQKYDSAQIILVGINDEHIRKALDDNGGDGGEYIGFVIPYHASGASINSFIASQLANITKHTETNDTFNQGDYNDYAPVQTDSVKSEVQRDDPNLEAIRQNPMNPKFRGNVSEAKRNALMQQYHRELRTAILTGKLSTKPKTQATTTEANRVLDAAQEYLDSLESVDITGRSFEDLREVERRALDGDADAVREYESWSMGLLKDLNAKMQNYGLVEEDGSIDRVYLSGQQAHAVMPHEYWNTNTTRANAYINGLIFRSYCYNLGLYPRFTGIKSDGKRARTTRPTLDADGNPMLDAKGQPVMEHYEYGDFSDEPGYWKTLIDRPMYDNRGVYRSQNPVNATNVSVKSLQPVDGETFTDDLALRAANDYLADKGVKHSLRRPVEGMYNLSERVIADSKQDKFGATSVVNMLRGKGVKAEEIKWLGIEDFLKGKKSVTKQELLDYIRANDLVIEEETLESNALIGNANERSYPDEWELVDVETGEVYSNASEAFEVLAEREGLDPDYIGFDESDGVYYEDPDSHDREILAEFTSDHYESADGTQTADETRWSEYATPGGANYREILFRMPGSDYTNRASEAHWRDEAPGVLAHARVQDFTTTDGKPILFVEEVQSDWHNEGQQKGYNASINVEQAKTDFESARTERRKLRGNAILESAKEKISHTFLLSQDPVARQNALNSRLLDGTLAGDGLIEHIRRHNSRSPQEAVNLSSEELESIQEWQEAERKYRQAAINYNAQLSAVPDAPFAKTYTDFVLKRLLREAAENGYDGLAWTTAQMQADRWSDEYIEGYRIEYDQDIPKFLNKFGKKFGAKVGTTEIIGEDGERTPVPYIPITDSMRESVMKEGTTKFSLRNKGEEQSTPSTPVSAFTEKGRKYSVRGQVPEFDAIFDFYANYGLTNDAPKAPPKPQVSRVRSKTYERMGVPRSFDAEHRQALEEAEFEYDPVTEQESMRRAEERLTKDYDGEKKDLAKRNWRSGEDLDTAMGILATEMNIAKKTGDYDETIEWLHLIREQGTKAGQFVQAFAKYNRSPEGIVARAVDALEKTKIGQDERKELIQKIADFAATLAKLRPKADGSVDPNALVDLIVQQAKQRNTKVSKWSMKVLQRLVNEGDVQYLYNFALTQLDQIAKDYIPASLGRKVGTYQTISHLLNPRTGNRNLLSNTAFGSIAATANNVAMLPDAIFGLLTGNGRMVGLDRGHLSSETWRGIKEGGARARLGINLDVQPDTNARDKYGTSKRTWKMTGNIVQRQLSRIEKLMAYELNWTDEFRKGGVRAEIIQSLAPMVAKGDITMKVAKEWAEQEALYRTFQDDTYVNKLLGNIKKLLNMKLVSEVDANGKKTYHIGQMDFGLGDIVQKYTQVPGALITRAIELSPAGYLKAIYLMGSMAKTASASKQAKTAYEVAKETAAKSDKERLKRAADRAFQKSVKADVVAKTAQRDAALALGRAITGTGLIAAFAALAKMGLLKRADDEDDPDAKALNAAEGISGTQLNLSAIGRLIHGGSVKWQKGDTLASVEFLEPLNNEMTMGSKIAQSIKGGKNDIGTFTLDTFDALYQSMQEIPTMQTLQTINQTIQYHKEDDPLPVWAEIPIEIARSGVTGFVPSLVRQTAQAMDPYYRDAYSSRDLGDQITSTVKSAIPGLREQLPVKLDNFGRPKAQENQPLNALNAFLIPGSVRTYQRSDTSQNLFDLYGQTGKANIFPDRSAPYNVSYSVDKQQTKFDLTPDERQKYQSMRGQTTLRTLINAMSDSWYKNATADQKVEITEKAKAYGNYKAKVEAAAAHGEVYSDSEYDHIDEALHLGYNMASYLTVKSQCNSFSADKDANGKSISGSKMNKIIDYLKSLNLTNQQKAYMFALTSGSNKTPFGSY